jgi:hypothetical protein
MIEKKRAAATISLIWEDDGALTILQLAQSSSSLLTRSTVIQTGHNSKVSARRQISILLSKNLFVKIEPLFVSKQKSTNYLLMTMSNSSQNLPP